MNEEQSPIPKESYETTRERVADHWADGSFTALLARAHWMASPVVCGYLGRLATGNPFYTWLRYLLDRYAQQRMHRILVLGCGDGWLERSIGDHPLVERIDAFDIAVGAIERAKEEAEKRGLHRIHYGVRDFNRDPIPDGPYELIVAHSIVHHIENLELFYQGVEHSLVPDGLLLIAEYVGPRRFQFSDRQLRIINALLAAMPARYRKGLIQPVTYEEKPRPTIEEMIHNDPSEAIRSNEIVAFTEKHFTVLESLSGGGTILMHLLYDIVQNFVSESKPDNAILSILCLVEELLLHRGAIPSDHIYIAASKSPLPAATTPSGPSNPYTDEAAPARRRVVRAIRSLLPHRPLIHPPGAHLRAMREQQNIASTGRANVDWIQRGLELAIRQRSGRPDDEGVRILALGKGAALLADRLRPTHGITSVEHHESTPASLPEGSFDLVFGLGIFCRARDRPGLAATIAGGLVPGGNLISMERTNAELPAWAELFASRILDSLPAALRKATGPAVDLRRLKAASAVELRSATELAIELERRFGHVEREPICSGLTPWMLASCDFATEPRDDGEEAIQRLVAALDSILVTEGLLEPKTVILHAVKS